MSRKPGSSAYLRSGYLASSERVLFETHPSKWFYFPSPVAYLTIVGVITYASATSVDSGLPAIGGLSSFIEAYVPSTYAGLPDPRTLLLIAGLVALLVGVVWLFSRMYDWIGDAYVLTDDRIIEQKGIIRTSQEDIPLNQIRDVEVQQLTYTSRFLRIGTVEFKSLSQLEVPPLSRATTTDHLSASGLEKTLPRFRRSRYLIDPRMQDSKDSGVESWVGVPNPVRIERLVEQTLRDRSSGPPRPPGYPSVV